MSDEDGEPPSEQCCAADASTQEASDSSDEDGAYVRLAAGDVAGIVTSVAVISGSPPAPGELLCVTRDAHRDCFGVNRATVIELERVMFERRESGDTRAAERAQEGLALLRFTLRTRAQEAAAAADGVFGEKEVPESPTVEGSGPRALRRVRSQKRALRRQLNAMNARAARKEEELAVDVGCAREALALALPSQVRVHARTAPAASLPDFVRELRAQRQEARAEAKKREATPLRSATSGLPHNVSRARFNTDSSASPGRSRSKSDALSLSPAAESLMASPPRRGRPGHPPRPGSAPVGARSSSPLAYAGQVYKAYRPPTAGARRLDHLQQEQSVDRLHYREADTRRKRQQRREDVWTRTGGLQYGLGVLSVEQQEELGDRLYRRQREKTERCMNELKAEYTHRRPMSAVLTADQITESTQRLYYQEQDRRTKSRERLVFRYVASRLPKPRTINPEGVREMADRLCPAYRK